LIVDFIDYAELMTAKNKKGRKMNRAEYEPENTRDLTSRAQCNDTSVLEDKQIKRAIIALVGLGIIWFCIAASANTSRAKGPNSMTNFRRPGSDEELQYWLKNMVWYHRFASEEIQVATGLAEPAIVAALDKFNIRPGNRPERGKDEPLLALPYPGGRHPRIGFLEGAIDPQRETKFSAFAPWDANSYVVVDVPEAIWSNLGLTYLAHTHIDTIWTKQDIELPKLEWSRHPNGALDIERNLPNGIAFGVKVEPTIEAVRMEMCLKNGTKQRLTDLRIQICVMPKMAPGF
jgi:hypothetical protein